MKWTSDPQSFSKAVYEAGTALFGAANDLLDALGDVVYDLESKFESAFPSERSDDGAADDEPDDAPSAAVDREEQVHSIVTEIVNIYTSNRNMAMARAWESILRKPDHIDGYTSDDRFKRLLAHLDYLRKTYGVN